MDRKEQLVKHFRRTKPKKLKSVEIELSEWVKFNEKQENAEIHVQKKSSAGGVKKRERLKAARDERLEQQAEEMLSGFLKNDSGWEKKKEYTLERKERMQTANEEMEQLKKEYRVLAEYHNDINLLQELPDKGTARIRETANVIVRLQNDRKAFQNDMTKLDDGKYMQMSQYTDDMPDVIKRLTSEELYVSKLKAEIDRMEGEKGEQQYESKSVEENQDKMKTLSIVCMFSLLVLFSVLLVLQLYFEADTEIFTLLCGIVFAIVTLGVFVRYFNNVNRAKTAEHQLNKIIRKQNKVKMKYVNAKNGVDYVYRKYNIHSASELLFQWEQFILTKNARENYQRSGNELSYYSQRLQRILEEYRIQDSGIWLSQVEYLANPEDMQQLKKELESKIEESKRKIDACRRAIQKAKDDISLLAIRNPDYAEAIRELTNGVVENEETDEIERKER